MTFAGKGPRSVKSMTGLGINAVELLVIDAPYGNSPLSK
jgi:hypothetical protein